MTEPNSSDGDGLQPTPPKVIEPKPPAGANGKKTVSFPSGNKETVKKVPIADGKSLSDDEFWLTARNITEKASREQQLTLARMVCGLLGANVSFPAARENRLLKEVKAASSVTQSTPKGPRAKKPENAALKNSAEYKEFVTAERELREAKAKLSIAKSDKTDPRVLKEAKRFEEARTKFLDLKKSTKH